MELSREFISNNSNFSSYDEFVSNFSIKIPQNFNFAYDVVDRYAFECPEKRALVWCNDKGDEKYFTFGEISKKSKQTANFLCAHGIKKGDVVMLMLRRQYEYWFFVLALHRIGAIAVPAAEQLMKNDIEYRIKAANVKMLVLSDSTNLAAEVEKSDVQNVIVVETSKKNQLKKSISYPSEIEKYSLEFSRPTGNKSTKNEDPMLIFFTSGTSDFPKMVVHNFLYPLGHIVTAKYWQKVQDNGLHFSMAETGWAKASWGKMYGQWICGSAVFTYDRNGFNPEKLLEIIKKYKITTFCAPPIIYRYLIHYNLSEYFGDVNQLCTAGETLNDEIFDKIYEKTGKKLFEGYGQTESTLIIANFEGMEIKKGAIGKPSPGYCVDVIDKNGNSCKNGEVGELVVDIKNHLPIGLFSGYYNDEKKTESVLGHKYYHTQDNVYRDDDGYFWFSGRKDDVIKSAGFRISPFEVEEILLQHPAVLECVVTGESDVVRGQVVKATVVLSEGFEASKILQNELCDFVKSKTALYKAPRIVEFVQSLPKTFNGKIKRSANVQTEKK